MSDDAEVDAVFRAETSVLFDDAEARLLAVERACRVLDQEWRALLGLLHTIKGNCGMVGRDEAEAACHELEHRSRAVRQQTVSEQADGAAALLVGLDQVRGAAIGHAPPARSGGDLAGEPLGPLEPVRAAGGATVAPSRLDDLLDTTDDVVAMLDRLSALPRAYSEVSHAASRSAHALRQTVMALRLVPLRTLLGRFVRPMHDQARHAGKQIDVSLQVGELSVDREIAERLGEPLLHVLRNAIDHGVETPAERVRAGKPERATVAIRAEVSAGRIVLAIRDDGRGIDIAALRAAASRRGLDVAGADRAALLDLVFASELSTARETTLVSGRGVGLDQSRRAIEAMGGAITVTSEAGAWTELRLRAPLALAMQRALVVRRADVRYAVPFRAAVEIARWSETADARGGIRWRDRRLPLVAPADGPGRAEHDRRTGVVVNRGDDLAAIAVDEVLGYQDVTIRRLDRIFGRPRGISGAAIALDGGVVLVLDPDALDVVRSPEAA